MSMMGNCKIAGAGLQKIKDKAKKDKKAQKKKADGS
jgi:hypothetical protein